ncbi:pre-mrna-splicing factor related protein [Cystoisospora suis]|uniref:Pre-mrna-splicing factor related protein n=1 Tax=Cystoisospora suis TaxID=483139 RepID=A0A2C6KHX3_9APIC|nr:pre-mrna-splicing factor related protein [Cystoisospora suis]
MRDTQGVAGRPAAPTAGPTSKLEYIKKYHTERLGSYPPREQGRKRRKRQRHAGGEDGLRLSHAFDEIDVRLPGRPSDQTTTAFEAARLGVLSAATAERPYQCSSSSPVEGISDPEDERDPGVVVVGPDGQNVDLSELQSTRVRAILRDQEDRQDKSERMSEPFGGSCTLEVRQRGAVVRGDVAREERRQKEGFAAMDIPAEASSRTGPREAGVSRVSTEAGLRLPGPCEYVARTTVQSGSRFSERTLVGLSRVSRSASRMAQVENFGQRTATQPLSGCQRPDCVREARNSPEHRASGASTADRDLSPCRRQPRPGAKELGRLDSASARNCASSVRARSPPPVLSSTPPGARPTEKTEGGSSDGEPGTDFSPVRRGLQRSSGKQLPSSEPLKLIRNCREEEGGQSAATQDKRGATWPQECKRTDRDPDLERTAPAKNETNKLSGQVVYRDRRGRIIEEVEWLELQNKGRTRAKERGAAPELEWGRGLVQKEAREKKAQEEEKIALQPLAQYDIDADYDKKLQKTRRWEDPLKQMPGDRLVHAAAQAGDYGKNPNTNGPVCPFDAPRNRFGVLPGYRWDGVVRGNGYEDRRLKAINRKKMEEHLAHLNNVADM